MDHPQGFLYNPSHGEAHTLFALHRKGSHFHKTLSIFHVLLLEDYHLHFEISPMPIPCDKMLFLTLHFHNNETRHKKK